MGTVLAGPQKDLDDTMILALLLLSSLFILPTSQEHDEAGRETSKHKGGNRDKGRSASESVQALQVSTAAGQEEVLKVPPTENKKLVKTAMYGGRCPGNRQIDRFSEAIGTNKWMDEGFRRRMKDSVTQASHINKWCDKVVQCNVRKYRSCCLAPVCKRRRRCLCQWTDMMRHGTNRLHRDKKTNSLQNVSSNPLRNGAETEHSVTLCDVAGGSSQMWSLEDLDADEASNLEEAKCAFILHEDDTTATCSDLAPHCDQRFSIATIACWKLNWCPRKIGRNYKKLKSKKKKDGAICCFHPNFKNRRECAWRKRM